MRSLTVKLIISFLVVGLTGVALVAFLAYRTTTREFQNYLFNQSQQDFADFLADYYEENGSWEGVMGFAANPGPSRPRGPRMGFEGGGPITLVDQGGVVLVSGPGQHMGDMLSRAQLESSAPIEVDGEIVGYLSMKPDFFVETRASQVFLERVNTILLIVAIGSSMVALVLGAILARTLTRPLKELTKATEAVAQGDLDQQVPVRSNDELGELAKSFNQMNANLARSRDLRRQMTADVAHELRTPLSVILGHTEAMKDGVMEPNQESFDIIHDETLRLSVLVEDLRTLSLAEAGELQLNLSPLSPEQLLNDVRAAYSPIANQRGISIEVETSPGLPEVNVDPDRMPQVLGNLVDNALRYTPEGGNVTLTAEYIPMGVALSVKDSGDGVDEEEIAHLFDRFYRGEKSRQRDEGGSGLGLAIAKSIVEEHGGSIKAERLEESGLVIVIELPT